MKIGRARLGATRRSHSAYGEDARDPHADAGAGAPIRDDLITGGRRWFGPFFAIFGSVATASAFLLFAGFLSDFAAYQMLGLPRLSFNLTSAAEIGAEVLVDIAALLVSGLRVGMLVLLVLLVTAVWARHDHPRIARLSHSVTAYRLSRIALLALSFLLFAAMAERANRTLSGTDAEPDMVAQALRDAYDDDYHFPTPDERQIAIERPTYALKWMRPINQLAPLELGWKRLQDCRVRDGWLAVIMFRCGERGDSARALFEPVSGFALRTMPESRFMARQTLGWWAVLVLCALVAHVLAGWWGQSLEGACDKRPGDAARETKGLAARAWATVQRLMGASRVESLHEGPLHRFIVPLTTLTLMLCCVLLPLGHGMLAKPSIGGETVAVFLKAPTSGATTKMVKADASDAQGGKDIEDVPVLYPEPSTDGHRTWPAGRFDCPVGVMPGDIPESDDMQTAQGQLDGLRRAVNEATRDLLQARETDSAVDQVKTRYERAVVALADGIVAQNCAERVRDFWAARPPSGLVAQAPYIGEIFRRHLLRVTVAFGLRLGTILSYPRAGQPMSLADSVVPRGATSGVWSVRSVGDQEAGEVVVLPDIFRSGQLDLMLEVLRTTPDNDKALTVLLVSPSVQALDAAIDFVEQGLLFSNERSVAITALGGMAWSSNAERPDLAREAIDLLNRVALGEAGAPRDATGKVIEDIRLRGSALSAMHLTRNPYAGWRLAEALRDEGRNDRAHWKEPLECERVEGGRTPFCCMPTATTAAGYLASDVGTEMERITRGHATCRSDDDMEAGRPCSELSMAPPASLLQTRGRLIDFLLRIVTAPDAKDDVRMAACTGLKLSGIRRMDDDQRKALLSSIEELNPRHYPLSLSGCLSQLSYLGMNGPDERALLEKVALGEHELVRRSHERDVKLLRQTALTVLYELGIARNIDLLLTLYLGDREAYMRDQAAKLLNQLPAGPVAEKLIACAANTAEHEGIRIRCIEGLKLLHNSYDGDQGGAAQLSALLEVEENTKVRLALCEVLVHFGELDSVWVRRRADELQSACSTTLPARKPDENEAERFRRELEGLLRQLRNVKPAENRSPAGASEGDRGKGRSNTETASPAQ